MTGDGPSFTRVYEHGGVEYVEWPGRCAGTDPHPRPGFSRPCDGDPVFVEALEAFDQRWLLGYCPDHRGQMRRYQPDDVGAEAL